jgi:hypothetical protein
MTAAYHPVVPPTLLRHWPLPTTDTDSTKRPRAGPDAILVGIGLDDAAENRRLSASSEVPHVSS